MKENGLKCYHKNREQSLSDQHKFDRVNYGRWLIENLGQNGSKGGWTTFLNTDFSALIRTESRHNSQNNVCYAEDRKSLLLE